MKRVLLTGAAGFIGRHMLEPLLRRGFEVHAVSRSTGEHADVSWHSCDLLNDDDTAALAAQVQATHLMHLAWVTEPGVYWEAPENRDWRMASMNLLRAFSESGGQRAVIAGTCAEYDWSGGHCVEDETPLLANSLYATSKLALREAAFEYAARNELSLAWGRVFFSFGENEREQRLVPAVILALLQGERAKCSDGSLLRDFMYVLDVAAAMTAVLDSDFSGDINIASGEALTLEALVNRIAVKLDGLDRVDFNHYPRRDGDPQKITADTSRLRDVIGWSPEYDLDSAIDNTIAWWKHRLEKLENRSTP